MSSVIVNEGGELYGGFNSETRKPIWFRTKRLGCVFDEETADKIVKQLKGLGFERIVKRDANGVIRKWVPADMDILA